MPEPHYNWQRPHRWCDQVTRQIFSSRQKPSQSAKLVGFSYTLRLYVWHDIILSAKSWLFAKSGSFSGMKIQDPKNSIILEGTEGWFYMMCQMVLSLSMRQDLHNEHRAGALHFALFVTGFQNAIFKKVNGCVVHQLSALLYLAVDPPLHEPVLPDIDVQIVPRLRLSSVHHRHAVDFVVGQISWEVLQVSSKRGFSCCVHCKPVEQE